MRRNPQEMGLKVDGTDDFAGKKRSVEIVDRAWAETGWTLASAAKEGRFWSLLIFAFLVVLPVYLVIIHGPKLLADSGFSRMDVAFMVAIMGVTTSISQIFWGWLSDRIGRELTFTLGVTLLAASLILLLLVEPGTAGRRLILYGPLRCRMGRKRTYVHGYCGGPFSG